MKARSWTVDIRKHRSKEAAAAFKAVLLAHKEFQRRKDMKGAQMTIEEIVRQAELYAQTAPMDPDIDGLDHVDMQGLADMEGDQHPEGSDGEMAGSGSGDVQPVRPETEAFDRLIQRFECGEGAGR